MPARKIAHTSTWLTKSTQIGTSSTSFVAARRVDDEGDD